MKNLLKSNILKSLVGGIAVLTMGTAANRVCMLREKKKPGFPYGQMIHSGGKNFVSA